jgi:hypothetical protein
VETKRFRLEGATLPELQARVRAQHGDAARIVSAERVTVGGVRGFFARRHIEVTVEVRSPDPAGVEPEDLHGQSATAFRQRRRAAHARTELATRLGIAALLDAADETEAMLAGPGDGSAQPGFPVPPVRHADGAYADDAYTDGAGTPERAPIDVPSTASPDFARLMDELTYATSSSAGPSAVSPMSTVSNGAASGAQPATRTAPDPAPIPADGAPTLTTGFPGLLARPGDLVLVIGPSAEVVEAAALMSAGHGALILAGPERPADRRAALAARARGVERGRGVLVVCELPGTTASPAGVVSLLTVLGADQVWVAVDAGRKPEDTARWVSAVAELLPIDAVAVLGIDRTGTPGTVSELGLPIGWLAPTTPPAGTTRTGRRRAAGSQNPLAIG